MASGARAGADRVSMETMNEDAENGEPEACCMTLEEARACFHDDRFATERVGAVIDAIEPGHARTSLKIEPWHLNARRKLMGGVSFSLADFAFAVETKASGYPVVSLDVSMEYFAEPKGTVLFADCRADKVGRTVVFATVVITDDTGRTIARMHANGYRVH